MGLIYMVRSLINNKLYIGQTTKTLIERQKGHEQWGSNYSILDLSIKKHGKSNFEWIIIEENINSQIELDKKEIYWIKKLNTLTPSGFNIKEGGNGGKQHPKTIKKISDKAKIRLSTPENNPMYGKQHSQNTKEQIRIKAKNRDPFTRIQNKTHRAKRGIKSRGTLFGFHGSSFKKNENPERKCWHAKINWKTKSKSLGYFNDPLTAQIVYDLVFNEIYGVV